MLLQMAKFHSPSWLLTLFWISFGQQYFWNILHTWWDNILRYSLCFSLSAFLFFPFRHPSRVSFLWFIVSEKEYDGAEGRSRLYICLAFMFQRPRFLEQFSGFAERVKERGLGVWKHAWRRIILQTKNKCTPGQKEEKGRTTEKGRGWREWGEWQERGEVERQRCRPPEPGQDCLSGDSRQSFAGRSLLSRTGWEAAVSPGWVRNKSAEGNSELTCVCRWLRDPVPSSPAFQHYWNLLEPLT